MEVPGGSWIALFMDPQGGAFAVQEAAAGGGADPAGRLGKGSGRGEAGGRVEARREATRRGEEAAGPEEAGPQEEGPGETTREGGEKEIQESGEEGRAQTREARHPQAGPPHRTSRRATGAGAPARAGPQALSVQKRSCSPRPLGAAGRHGAPRGYLAASSAALRWSAACW